LPPCPQLAAIDKASKGAEGSVSKLLLSRRCQTLKQFEPI
jgi:hypothetical protein